MEADRLTREALDAFLVHWSLDEEIARAVWLLKEVPGETTMRSAGEGHRNAVSDQDLETAKRLLTMPDLQDRLMEERCLPSPFNALETARGMAGIEHEAEPIVFDEAEFQESGMFSRGRDVAIRRHGRFSPVFLHSHRFIELTWVYRGTCRQWMDEVVPDRCVDLAQGDLLILPPGARHAVGVFDESILLNVLIRESTFDRFFLRFIPENTALSDFFGSVLFGARRLGNAGAVKPSGTAGIGAGSGPVVFRTNDDPELRGILQDMMIDLCEDRAFSNESVNLRLGLFFTLLIRSHVDGASFPGPARQALSAIPPILRYMQDHQHETSLSDVAERFRYSQSWISRLFQRHVGASFIDTLTGIRMRTAEELLLHTNRSVEEISNAVGYGDATHFIRMFRRHAGTTPHQFRTGVWKGNSR